METTAQPGSAMTGVEPLRPQLRRVDPRDLTLAALNARFMRKETYDRLVENVRRDGALTSTPLVWDDRDSGRMVVLSGNHRVMAAIDAGLAEIDIMVVEQPLSQARQVAMQLSHNAIIGEDDPATLRQLYEQLDDVDWRTYSGLDDKQLDLLAQVDLEGLAEANLDFATIQLVFLPHELDTARTALEQARAVSSADGWWLAAYRDYEPVLDALATAHAAHNVGNVATALGVVLAVFERHLGELRDGVWYDPDTGAPDGHPRHMVPIETIVEARTMPADVGSVVARAVDRAVSRGDIDSGARWRVLELWASRYLADT